MPLPPDRCRVSLPALPGGNDLLRSADHLQHWWGTRHWTENMAEPRRKNESPSRQLQELCVRACVRVGMDTGFDALRRTLLGVVTSVTKCQQGGERLMPEKPDLLPERLASSPLRFFPTELFNQTQTNPTIVIKERFTNIQLIQYTAQWRSPFWLVRIRLL